MTFFEFEDEDKVLKRSQIRQLVDVLAADISGSISGGNNTRKKYEVFLTGSGNNYVTSSLFHTVFDQTHTLQTANEMLDITIGSYAKYKAGTSTTDPEYYVCFKDQGSTAITAITASVDSSNKPIFSSHLLMMREKINIYKQYAQVLLGDGNQYFTTPYDDDVANDEVDRINHAIFINIKRLFTRDGLDKEKFSMKIGKKAGDGTTPQAINAVSTTLSLISDTNAKSSLTITPQGGSVGTIVDSSSPDPVSVGLLFYENGIIVLDAEKVLDPSQVITGKISTVVTPDAGTSKKDLPTSAKFIPDVWITGSIDDVVDHVASTRFGSADTSAMGLINKTSINSTIYFCRVAPAEGNFSTNPTYTDSSGSLRCIEERGDDPFSYVTTIGLYDAPGNMLAVAKTSRPIEKNPEVDLSISVRIDY